MAVAMRGLEPPPVSCMIAQPLGQHADLVRRAGVDRLADGAMSEDRSVTEDSQFSSSV